MSPSPRILVSAGAALLILISAVLLYRATPVTPLLPALNTDLDKKTSASVLMVGDMFFDRYIRIMMETVSPDFIFSCIYHVLKEADFAVGNLEGPITENLSVSKSGDLGNPDHFRFTFPVETAGLLKRNNFGAVSLGNNHIGNFGTEGIAETKRHLDGAGVGYFGGLKGDEPVFRTEKNGVPLSFVGYNQFGGADVKAVSETVTKENASGRRVIVYAHWGDEYSTSTDSLRPIALALSEAGASAIIGSHPHVVMPHEFINDTLVYYSLGNFIFDQYWNADVSTGLALLLMIPADPEKRVSVTEYTTILQSDGRVCEGEPSLTHPQ